MKKTLDPTRKPMRTPSIPSKEVLQALCDEKMPVRDICDRLGYSRKSNWLIYKYMETYGIAKYGDRFDRLRVANPLTNYQRQLIVGMLLGDASIPALRRKDKNHLLTFGHTGVQEDYAVWKAEKMVPFNRPLDHVMVSLAKGQPKIYKRVIFNSMHHPDFTPIRALFYPEGKKIVPANISDLLTLPAIAIWYMDDGSLSRWHTGLGAYCEFATHSFTHDDQVILVAALEKHCGVNARLTYSDSPRVGGSGWRLYLPKADSYRFAEIMRPHFHPSMLYKLP